jgi:molybdate transport system substrate-binding protein
MSDSENASGSPAAAADNAFDPAAAGWEPYGDDGFIGLVGPLWARPFGDSYLYAFKAEHKHHNRRGIVQGGMLMTFADRAMGMTCWYANNRQPQATVQLDVHFIDAVQIGEFVEAKCRIVRRTRSLVFMAADLVVGTRVVATAVGVWKTLGTASASTRAGEILILSAAALREIVVELGEQYARQTGVKLVPEFTRSPLVRNRIRAGEAFDIAMTTRSRIDELAKENKVAADSAIALARSGIGVAVKAGRPKPDIGSVQAFARALRAADSIACADPAFGTASGLYLAELFVRLGLATELKAKIRLVGAEGGEAVVVCAAVASGEAELGLQQIAEIVAVPGVDLVGPLPDEIQHTTIFSAALAAAAPQPDLARDFLTFLMSPAAKAVVAAHGMEPN